MEGCIAKTGDIYQICAVVSDLDQVMRNWVKYIDNMQYPAPNYLTPRYINVKLVMEF